MHQISAPEVQHLAQQAANYYTRTLRSAAHHASDLLQEATLAILQARATFNPGFENAKGEGESTEARFATYAYRAACIACRRYLWRNKLPVQVPRRDAERDLGIQSVALDAPAPMMQGEAGHRAVARSVADDTENALERYAAMQLSGRIEKLLKDAAAADRELKHGVKLVLSGEKPREYAARTKVPVSDVYSSSSRLKKALKASPEALQLWQEV